MVSVQPIHLIQYLSLKRSKTPHNLKCLFYLSWEDALWDLLLKKRVKKCSTILVPNFYCVDVENNIISHGYKVNHYPVNKDFSVNSKLFKSKIKSVNPAIIVILHSVGITNNLLKNPEWIKELPPETIVIEDCAHRLVNPQNIKIIRKNYFIIDSLRKVVPLQGSRVFGLKEDLNFDTETNLKTLIYSSKVTALWLLMLIFWNLSQISYSTRLSLYFGVIAEKLMLLGYDVIGDSPRAASGSRFFAFLTDHLNYDKIYKVKDTQAKLYEKNLTPAVQSKNLYNGDSRKELRHYPVILPIKSAGKILNYLRSRGLIVRFELDDSPWSQKQKVIYLPLGLHINEKKQLNICNLVNKSFKNIS